jgi:hypothetical protein
LAPKVFSSRFFSFVSEWLRVARFLLVHDTQAGKNVPNGKKMYQMVKKYPKYPQNIPNGHKIYQHFPI